MTQFWALLTKVDRYIGPVYRILFVTSILIAVVTWLVYVLLPYVTIFYNWADARVTDFGPIISAPSAKERITISLLFGLIGGIASLLWRFNQIQNTRIAITEEIRRCTASHIKYYDELFTLITGRLDLSSDTKMQMISEASRTHSIFLCSRLAEIFQLATGAPCHASIKSFNPATEMVTTRTRDALMHNHDRSLADDSLKSYPSNENTGFDKILTDAGVGVYINNYLRLSSLIGAYTNANPNWRRNYCATVVAPITPHLNPATITKNTVIGFVCVDSKRGVFPSRYSRAVLNVFVVLINDMMTKLGEMEAT